MSDYTNEFKKQAAKAFIQSKFNAMRFCQTFSNRQIDPVLLVEWVKDLTISLECDVNFWHEQSNKQNVIINNLDAEIEGLHLKVNQLAEQNAKLASDGIKVTNKLADMSEGNRVLQSVNNDLLAENKKLKDGIESRNESIRVYMKHNEKLVNEGFRLKSEIINLQSENQSLRKEIENLKFQNKNVFDENHELYTEIKDLKKDVKNINNLNQVLVDKLNIQENLNQSLMSEIEELKSMAGHRDNMQFIAICEKIVQDAEELKKHLEGGK